MSAWVIERYHNSVLEYWNGESVQRNGFHPDHERAIRFAREEDAAHVLCWMLDGNGRTTQAIWKDNHDQA